MFTPSESETFAVHGLLKRKNFLPLEKLTNARNAIFQQLEQAGIWRNGGWSLDECVPATGLTAGMALVKPLNRHPTIIALTSDEAPTAPAHWSMIALSFPWTAIRRCSLRCPMPPRGRSPTRTGIWIIHWLHEQATGLPPS